MKYNGLLQNLPTEIKWFVATFVLVLSIGFFTGLAFVNQTSTAAPSGIEENYLGNEDDTNASIMKFKKSAREMLSIVHTHILSMSFIFFLLGGLVWIARLPKAWKLFLTIEPFLSVLLTFGGIYFMWTGILWMKYIVLFSGILMTLTYTVSAALVLYQLAVKQTSAHN
ncbi:MAG: hypothetical protein ABF293_09625 [Flavobacteriaceae bacterium]